MITGTRRASKASRMTSLALYASAVVSFLTLATAPLTASAALHPDFRKSLQQEIQKELTASLHSSDASDSESIRVKLETFASDSMTITGIGLRASGLPFRRAGLYQALRVSYRYSPSGWHDWTIADRDSNETLAQIKARKFEVVGESLRFNLRPIPGRLAIHPLRAKNADLIASLGIEEYVRGVLPAEMPSSWPLEALKAQAVAARSFALARKKERASAPYHLEAGVMDQMFLLPVLEPGSDEARARTDQAVRETRGLILTRAGSSEPLAAFFHADCGGRTERAAQVWGEGSASAGTAIDGACPLNPLAKWHAKISAREVATRLRKARLALQDIQIVDRTESGRVNQMKFVWSDGTATTLTAHEFRMAVGHERIRSTNFEVEADRAGSFELRGSGFGHGVGLCQWGARYLAQSGRSAREILQHYYPEASLR